MASLSTINTVVALLQRLGISGTLDLVQRKIAKAQRYKTMLRSLPSLQGTAKLNSIELSDQIAESDNALIIQEADKLLRDQNLFFTFTYRTRNFFRSWNYDPIEKKYWPKRHYTEKQLHASDTPSDAKIVWEINRFKDLPTLAQAAYLTKDAKYVREIESRFESWISENPVGESINWASALEISIRLIAWTAALRLLHAAGNPLLNSERIERSILQHIVYLAGDLSTDKVVPTNHLIGEVAGLYIASTVFDFSNSKALQSEAKRILETEILRQTHDDGATKEASSWYHGFVTDLFDLAERVAPANNPFSAGFSDRLSRMKAYRNALTMNREIVRYGDADDGYAVYFTGDITQWKSAAFGIEVSRAASASGYFQSAQHVAAHPANSFLFLRAGQFGMGGAGYSSHAHNDFLSPIIFLARLPILVDPGTYIYNGDSEGRAKYRGADAHNGLVFQDSTVQRMNFGWHSVRPTASIINASLLNDKATVTARYGDLPGHTRTIEVTSNTAVLTDTFDATPKLPVGWRLHLAPMWLVSKTEKAAMEFSSDNHILRIEFHGAFQGPQIETFDYSPSYRVRVPASMIRLECDEPKGEFQIRLKLLS